MSGYKVDIEKKTKNNNNYRKVLYTDKRIQLVLMSIDNDIPMETHKHITQFVRVESGTGYALINRKKYSLVDGISVIIPAKAKHYIKSTGKRPLKIYTIYSPPEHNPGAIQKNQLE